MKKAIPMTGSSVTVTDPDLEKFRATIARLWQQAIDSGKVRLPADSDLVQNLGFTGASILREGELIDLSDIDGRIEEIKKRISDHHRVSKKLHKTVFDVEPTFKLPAVAEARQSYGDLSDLKRNWIIAAHRCAAPADWIADRLNLPVETVEMVIRDAGT